MAVLCAFDLDHTLVRSPLDLKLVRVEIRQMAARRGVPLPEETLTWTIAQTIAAIGAHDPALEAECWALVLSHETAALEGAVCEPGAVEAVAVWTNNARRVTEVALGRCGLRPFFATVVTRDEAALKPDPAGLRLLRAAYPERAVWVVGDSWVDGAAAQAGGAAFIAYGTDPAELARRAVHPHAVIHDLRALPAWLAPHMVASPD
jgi:phosphoglycolate phosphatase